MIIPTIGLVCTHGRVLGPLLLSEHGFTSLLQSKHLDSFLALSFIYSGFLLFTGPVFRIGAM